MSFLERTRLAHNTLRYNSNPQNFNNYLSILKEWAEYDSTLMSNDYIKISTNKIVSICMCCNRKEKGLQTIKMYDELLKDVKHEFVIIEDAESMCEGYNRAIKKATGDILIFTHDDVEIISKDFASKLLNHLAVHDLFGVAGTSMVINHLWSTVGWPHLHGIVLHKPENNSNFLVMCFNTAFNASNCQVFDGLFFAVNRRVIEKVQFDEQYPGWHFYDMDFSYSCYLAGFDIGICSDIILFHESMGNYNHQFQLNSQIFIHKRRNSFASVRNLHQWCGTTFPVAKKEQAIFIHQKMLQFV